MDQNQAQWIGLSGGIATGKTTVCNYLEELGYQVIDADACLLYTSPSPRDLSTSRMPSSA